MRVLRTPLFALIASGLLPICVGGLSGCDSRPGNGELVEPEHIDDQQKADVKAQLQRQMAERKKKAMDRGGSARRR